MNLLLRSLFSPSGPRLPRSTVSSVAIRTKALARHRQVAIAAQVIVGRGPPKRKRKFHMCNTLVQKRNIIEEPLSRQTRQHSILAKWIRWSRSAPACSSLIVADSRSHFPNLHRFTLFRYCKPSRSCYGDRHGHGDANSTRLLLLRHRPPLVSLCYCVAVAPAALARLPAAPCLLRASASKGADYAAHRRNVAYHPILNRVCQGAQLSHSWPVEHIQGEGRGRQAQAVGQHGVPSN